MSYFHFREDRVFPCSCLCPSVFIRGSILLYFQSQAFFFK